MKGRCISEAGTEYTFICAESSRPAVGTEYLLEDATTGTGAQNRAFHALVLEYWKSGAHAKYGGDPFDEFRDKIKRDLGAGFESYVYAYIENGKARLGYVQQYADIPDDVRHDPDLKEMIRGRLKSWSDYTKKQRKETIDNLIDDMTAAGVNSKKFDEIIKGMQG